jgi:ABC-type taurine transport system substrate-binding protein
MLVFLLAAVLVHCCSAVSIAVSDLKPTTTDADLKQIFSAFGQVDAAYVNRNAWGQSQLTGKVVMPDERAATMAVSRLVSFSAWIIKPPVLPRVVPPGTQKPKPGAGYGAGRWPR